jgi:hypothetical protein
MAYTAMREPHEHSPFPLHRLKHSMIVKLQLVLQPIAEVLQHPNILDHPFVL